MSYSLTAHSPYEGWRAAINGTEGRIELEEIHSGPRTKEPSQQIKLFNRKGEVITYDIQKAAGDHGGGDERIRRMIFVGDVQDPLGHRADSWAGAMSAIIGIASNISIAEGRTVDVSELIKK